VAYWQAVRRAAMVGLVGAVLAIGCEAPPAFPVPDGVRRFIVVDAALPVEVLGTWTIDSFVEALGVELAKYRIVLEKPEGHRLGTQVHVTLGSFAPRQWQSVNVYFDEETAPAGSVRVPDATLTTFEVAAEPVAMIIARRVWGVAGPSATEKTGDGGATP
jgi:hypothetical protein